MLPNWYIEYQTFIESSIDFYLVKYITKSTSNPGLQIFRESIIYATGGGKKIRSILALEFYLSFSGIDLHDISVDDDIVKFLVALEIIHAFSLIHDDLPCMDNDEYRRGELTTWKKYGEYQAVLAGDLLNTLTFEILSDISDPIIAVKLIRLISSHTGFSGMVGGQISDMYFEENIDTLTYSDLIELHNKKTGALIKASVLGGILLSGHSEKAPEYEAFGEKLGLAFQIKDDLLDVEGSFKETGKSIGGEKKGFVYFLGLERTREELNQLIDACFFVSDSLTSDKLDFIVTYIRDRKR